MRLSLQVYHGSMLVTNRAGKNSLKEYLWPVWKCLPCFLHLTFVAVFLGIFRLVNNHSDAISQSMECAVSVHECPNEITKGISCAWPSVLNLDLTSWTLKISHWMHEGVPSRKVYGGGTVLRVLLEQSLITCIEERKHRCQCNRWSCTISLPYSP